MEKYPEDLSISWKPRGRFQHTKRRAIGVRDITTLALVRVELGRLKDDRPAALPVEIRDFAAELLASCPRGQSSHRIALRISYRQGCRSRRVARIVNCPVDVCKISAGQNKGKLALINSRTGRRFVRIGLGGRRRVSTEMSAQVRIGWSADCPNPGRLCSP